MPLSSLQASAAGSRTLADFMDENVRMIFAAHDDDGVPAEPATRIRISDPNPQSTAASVARIRDPGLQALYRYWVRKKRDRLMPSRVDIDITELPGHLWP